MVERIVSTFVNTLILLLLAALILALGGCGGGSSSSGGGGGTTSAKTGGEETTSAKTGGEGTAPAEIARTTVDLTPSQDSGVIGVATFTDTSGGAKVVLNMQNLPGQSDTEHLAHIHEGGTCADDRAGNGAPVQYPLNPVITEQDGLGTSTTVIPDATVDQLFSGDAKYVNVHAEQTGGETPPGISCADLSSRGDTTTGGGGAASGSSNSY